MKIAIIPARGGSKRIPRKNLKPFCGKPIIAYSIEAALKSGLFDHVICSTDDEEIAALARSLGATTPFMRPPELANDHATTVPVIKHALQWANDNLGPVEYGCCIYATAPFVQSASLIAAYEKLIANKVTGYVFTATTFPFPIQRAFKVHENGFVEMFHPENYNTRSQDLEEAFQDAGQFYWGSMEAYMSEKFFFATDSMVHVLPRYMVQDIDTLEDWTRAELMYQSLRQSGAIA